MLKMPEDVFWKCTPRKLLALTDVHTEILNAKAGEGPKKRDAIVYIDQV